VGAASGADALLLPRDSPVHRLPAHAKLVAVVLFAVTVVATGASAAWAFAAYAALLAGVVALARLPAGTLARRMLVEVPFVVFALLLPFVATGPRVDVLGVPVSADGLVGAGLLLAKATLGTLAAVVLAATTPAGDLLAGLARLRVPPPLVAITAFMVRYAAVVADDVRRMRLARLARGGRGVAAGGFRAVAAATGTLFVRSYERGERVHLAMLARGSTGVLPLRGRAARPGEWAAAAALPAAALAALAAVSLAGAAAGAASS
jgi:cobalt/nickel transport system permease protein